MAKTAAQTAHDTVESGLSPARVVRCVIVTPEATVRDKYAQFVVVPLYDGELGIAPGHAPLIGRLGFGELRITEGGVTESFYVDGGFVEVVDNVISVLTGRAIDAAQLDAAAISEQLAAARARPATTPELQAIRDRLVDQARAQLRIAERRN